MKVSAKIESIHAAAGTTEAVYLGEFILKLVGAGGLGLGTVIGAWLQAKYGRKVRLKVGETEAEAQTVEEAGTLLKLAQQQQMKSKATKRR